MNYKELSLEQIGLIEIAKTFDNQEFSFSEMETICKKRTGTHKLYRVINDLVEEGYLSKDLQRKNSSGQFLSCKYRLVKM